VTARSGGPPTPGCSTESSSPGGAAAAASGAAGKSREPGRAASKAIFIPRRIGRRTKGSDRCRRAVSATGPSDSFATSRPLFWSSSSPHGPSRPEGRLSGRRFHAAVSPVLRVRCTATGRLLSAFVLSWAARSGGRERGPFDYFDFFLSLLASGEPKCLQQLSFAIEAEGAAERACLGWAGGESSQVRVVFLASWSCFRFL